MGSARFLLSALVLCACSDAPTPIVPPEPEGAPLVPFPPPNKAGDGPGYTFAVSRLRLGARDEAGLPDPEAWRSLGRNLDGRDDEGEPFVGHCAPVGPEGTAPPPSFVDGADGIDNGFGGYLYPQLIAQFSGTVEEDTNVLLATGERTLLVQVDALGNGSSYNPLEASLYEGGLTPAPPLGDGSDVWPVFAGSAQSLPSSYVTSHTWVSAPAVDLRVPLDFGGYRLVLHVHAARLVLDLAPDRASAKGVLAGVLDAEELTAQVAPIAGFFAPQLCQDPSALAYLEDLVRGAADVLHGGTAFGACNGISIGVGVELVRAELGGEIPPPPPQPDPCAG